MYLKKKKNNICKITNVFPVTFYQFNGSLLNNFVKIIISENILLT